MIDRYSLKAVSLALSFIWRRFSICRDA